MLADKPGPGRLGGCEIASRILSPTCCGPASPRNYAWRFTTFVPARDLPGFLNRDLPPILTIDSGDRVCYQTLDAAWGAGAMQPARRGRRVPRHHTRDPHHALSGPVAIRGAEPGMTLEIHFRRIRTGRWGVRRTELPSQLDARLGITGGASGPPAVILLPQGRRATFWQLNPDAQVGTSMPACNCNCALPRLRRYDTRRARQSFDLSAACLWRQHGLPRAGRRQPALPAHSGQSGLLWIGDGHAIQGDGEVAGPALACPMDPVEIQVTLHPELRLTMPRANTAAGWITFGFHADLNEAAAQAALDGQAAGRTFRTGGQGSLEPGEPGRQSARHADGQWSSRRACRARAPTRCPSARHGKRLTCDRGTIGPTHANASPFAAGQYRRSPRLTRDSQFGDCEHSPICMSENGEPAFWRPLE